LRGGENSGRSSAKQTWNTADGGNHTLRILDPRHSTSASLIQQVKGKERSEKRGSAIFIWLFRGRRKRGIEGEKRIQGSDDESRLIRMRKKNLIRYDRNLGRSSRLYTRRGLKKRTSSIYGHPMKMRAWTFEEGVCNEGV